MLKKMRKRLRRRRLAQAVALALALSCPAVPASADIGAQSFTDGQPHTVTDNIVANSTAGLGVRNPGTSATMNGWSITTTGDESHGAYAMQGGAISLANAAVTTAGDDIHGLAAAGAGSTVTMTGGSVATTCNNGYGARAWSGGAISLANAAITASGAGGASRLTGVTVLAGGGTADLTLNGNAVWTMPGDSSLTTLSLSGGAVSFAAPAAGGPSPATWAAAATRSTSAPTSTPASATS